MSKRPLRELRLYVRKITKVSEHCGVQSFQIAIEFQHIINGDLAAEQKLFGNFVQWTGAVDDDTKTVAGIKIAGKLYEAEVGLSYEGNKYSMEILCDDEVVASFYGNTDLDDEDQGSLSLYIK